MTAEDLGPWEPLSVDETAALFSRFGGRWWVAGGHAIELALGRTVRSEHADIDVVVTRNDHRGLHALLSGWELWAADPPGALRRWWPDEELPITVHDIWCRREPAGPWRLQVMIDETDGDEWVSRRDRTLRRPLRTTVARTEGGIPHLVPAVQLYYKSRRPRPRDEIDFRAALPALSAGDRAWLREAITTDRPDHPWLASLPG